MFKLLLITKYLRRRLAPLFAAAAVVLCTAMVIIVISVMGGFLTTLRASIQRLSPAITVTTGGLGGIPHYQALCDRLETLPQVQAATPVMQTLGLMEYGGQRTDVQVVGIRPRELDRVVRFQDVIHWRAPMFVKHYDRLIAEPDQTPEQIELLTELRDRMGRMDLTRDAMAMRLNDFWRWATPEPDLPGVVPGVAAIPFNRRDRDGKYRVNHNAIGDEMTLTVVPLTRQGGLQDPVLRKFLVVNEFKSGHYDYDSGSVFVPFDQLQAMLRQERVEAPTIDPATGEETGGTTITPGRATAMFVATAPGVPLQVAQDAIDTELGRFMSDHLDAPRVYTLTWEEQNAVLLAAVSNEKNMVTFLFVFISIVAVVMVALTFYNIVLQKTWDIGVLRAIGASRSGILGVFLGYGLAIGILGGFLGLGLAMLIVYNLNEIQTLLDFLFGWRMWDPRIYAFDTIPEQIDPVECGLIVLGAIVSSVVGAAIPAIKAARLKPVEAIRYE